MEPTTRRARTLAEVTAHIAAWNASPSWQRAFLLRAALPIEAASFVAHSNALEGVATLSAADTLEMVQQSAAMARDPEAERAALNTYDAFRLARVFRLERAEAGIGAADELLWHVPQALAIHRTLMAHIHPHAGHLRFCDARPKDRAALYVPAAAVCATVWSFFDVANGCALRLSGDATGKGGSCGGEEALEEGLTGADDDINEAECASLLAAAPAGPDLRDIDPRALEGVIEHSAWFAAHFLEIHPFGDGNGRLTRILVDAMLARVHPVPVPLVPAGASLEEARTRYLDALREVPPWGQGGGASWASSAPSSLSELILESLAASWRRLSSIQCSLFGGGSGPFLGVLILSRRASTAARSVRYARLGHSVRARMPSAAELAAEVSALPPPQDGHVLVAGSPAFCSYAPTGRVEEGWCSVGWVP